MRRMYTWRSQALTPLLYGRRATSLQSVTSAHAIRVKVGSYVVQTQDGPLRACFCAREFSGACLFKVAQFDTILPRVLFQVILWSICNSSLKRGQWSVHSQIGILHKINSRRLEVKGASKGILKITACNKLSVFALSSQIMCCRIQCLTQQDIPIF